MCQLGYSPASSCAIPLPSVPYFTHICVKISISSSITVQIHFTQDLRLIGLWADNVHEAALSSYTEHSTLCTPLGHVESPPE